MTDDTTEFDISRPIVGDKQDTSKPEYEQWNAEAFLKVIDDVLAIPGVKKLRWEQYTPYFNDGEPCEFGVGELRVRVKGWDKEGGDYDDGYYDAWSLGYYAKENNKLIVPEGLQDAMNKWASAHFETVARKNFGDHAVVTASSKGFEVEFYDHE